jgi:hypothetical protein
MANLPCELYLTIPMLQFTSHRATPETEQSLLTKWKLRLVNILLGYGWHQMAATRLSTNTDSQKLRNWDRVCPGHQWTKKVPEKGLRPWSCRSLATLLELPISQKRNATRFKPSSCQLCYQNGNQPIDTPRHTLWPITLCQHDSIRIVVYSRIQ